MAFQPPSARQELANRKILEEIRLKKQQILKQGVAPSLNSPTITPSLSAVGTTVNLPVFMSTEAHDVTTCFSCSPPDLNLVVTNFMFVYM